jgi:16S rRNA G1207 methylase RsmC
LTAGCHTVLDIGAGPGAYGFHLAEANPALRLDLVDLPEILGLAGSVMPRRRP